MLTVLQDPGDVYEFVCDTTVQPSSIQTFEVVSMQCQFERKFKRSYETATEKELNQFIFTFVPPTLFGAGGGADSVVRYI